MNLQREKVEKLNEEWNNAIKLRDETIKNIEKLRKEYLDVKDKYSWSKIQIEVLKRDLKSLELKNDELKQQKISYERINEVQKKQMITELSVLKESFTCEKDAKEKWLWMYDQ